MFLRCFFLCFLFFLRSIKLNGNVVNCCYGYVIHNIVNLKQWIMVKMIYTWCSKPNSTNWCKLILAPIHTTLFFLSSLWGATTKEGLWWVQIWSQLARPQVISLNGHLHSGNTQTGPGGFQCLQTKSKVGDTKMQLSFLALKQNCEWVFCLFCGHQAKARI